MSSFYGGMYGRKKPASSMDILYLLLPIIGAFLLLFLVCCFGKKVKEMLHIPKELVLGRTFAGLASSTSSSSSSRLSLSESEDDEQPSLVINVNTERQRVMSQYRRRYAQVPSDEMVFSLAAETDCHSQSPEEHTNRAMLPRYNDFVIVRNSQQRNSKHSHRRADSCPLLAENMSGSSFESGVEQDMAMYIKSSTSNSPYHQYHHRFYHNFHNNNNNIDADSDSDSATIPVVVVVPEKPDRRRHRSNSESDLPKRGSLLEQDYLADQKVTQCSHQLASTEFQLHAPQYCSSLLTGSDCDQCSNNQAEVA